MVRKFVVPLSTPEVRTKKIDYDPPGSGDILMGSSVNVNGNTFYGFPNPVNSDWAATKGYVDSVTVGTVRAAALSNITLSGTQTVDSVALAAGDRVLAAAQTTTSQNGPWVVQTGAWTRPTDYAAGSARTKGLTYRVTEGVFYPLHEYTLMVNVAAVDTTASDWRVVTFLDVRSVFSPPASLGDGHTWYDTGMRVLKVRSSGVWYPANGVMLCTSTTRPSFPGASNVIYETDTSLTYIYDGTTWKLVGGGGSGTDEVWVGPDAPSDPNIELWYDSDAVSPVTPNDTGWIAFPYEGGATDLSSASYPGMYRRLNGVVYLKGLIRVGTSVAVGTVLTTLPVGFRPSGTTHFSAPASTSAVTRLNVKYDGTITINYTGAALVASSSWIGVDHCSFPADA